MKKQYQGILVYLALMLAFMWFFGQLSEKQQADTAYSYTQFVEAVEAGDVRSAQISQNKEVPTGKVVFTLENGEQKNTNLPDVNKAESHMLEHEVEVTFGDVEEENLLVTIGLPFLLSLVVVFVLFTLLNRQAGGGGGKMADFGKSKAQMIGKGQVDITFDHVAGLLEEKEDLQEIVDFLKEPSKYMQVGARIPKGVLLEGPPGTGKTLLAKAVAGEAKVQLPITTDYRMARSFAKRLSPSLVEVQGTDISDAIDLASLSFSQREGASRVMILITDGEAHDSDALAAAERAAERGIRIFTIGIGSPKGAPIQINGEFIQDEKGEMVVSRLNEELLQQIAERGNGGYIRASNAEFGLSEIVDEVEKMEKSERSTLRFDEYNEQFYWILWVVLGLLLMEGLLLERRNPRLRRFNIFEK